LRTGDPHSQEARRPVVSLGAMLLLEIRPRIPKEHPQLSLVVVRAALWATAVIPELRCHPKCPRAPALTLLPLCLDDLENPALVPPSHLHLAAQANVLPALVAYPPVAPPGGPGWAARCRPFQHLGDLERVMVFRGNPTAHTMSRPWKGIPSYPRRYGVGQCCVVGRVSRLGMLRQLPIRGLKAGLPGAEP
jgi:hypothetical protein